MADAILVLTNVSERKLRRMFHCWHTGNLLGLIRIIYEHLRTHRGEIKKTLATSQVKKTKQILENVKTVGDLEKLWTQ